jgi:hypothetical protein
MQDAGRVGRYDRWTGRIGHSGQFELNLVAGVQDELFVAGFSVGEKLRAIRKQSTVPNLKVGHGHPPAGSLEHLRAAIRR